MHRMRYSDGFQCLVCLSRLGDRGRYTAKVSLATVLDNKKNSMNHPQLSESQQKTVLSALQEHDLSRVAQSVLSNARPQLVLSGIEIGEDPQLGKTRFGGSPDLPSGTVWPDWDGEPLRFMAQIRFCDLDFPCDWPLPKAGLLSIFAGYADDRFDVEHELIFTTDLGALRRLEAPKLPWEMEHLLAYPAKASMGISIPGYDDLEWNEMELDDEETNRYFDVQNMLTYKNWDGALLGRDYDVDQRPTHRLAIDEMDGPPYDTAWENLNRPRILAEARNWVPLFQMSSLMEIGLCLWDAYAFVVLIRLEDLRAGRFDETRGHLARI